MKKIINKIISLGFIALFTITLLTGCFAKDDNTKNKKEEQKDKNEEQKDKKEKKHEHEHKEGDGHVH